MTSQMAPTPALRPKILFADDHRIILDALSYMASSEYEVRSVDNLKSLEAAIEEVAPDLVVLDIKMPDGDGLEAARRLIQARPGIKVMFLSLHSEPRYTKMATDIGAVGYLSKHAAADELLAAIRTVLDGGTYFANPPQSQAAESVQKETLTQRQQEVLRLISQGCSAKEIATRLNISVRTAEFHRAAIMDRLKLHSTAMMTRYAVERGLD